MATPSTSVLRRWKYDAFVSFRGEDIRKGFRDHLFKDFEEKGINVFRDDNINLIGKELPPVLHEAIEGSWFLIVIFSKNFADSSWCLRELTKILECKRKGEPKHEVRFVFYDVKPNVVRNQTESYAEAFSRHEDSNTIEVAKWKKALREAANFIGRDLQEFENGYESKLVDDISKGILEMTYKVRPMDVGKKLVGVDDQIEKADLSRFLVPDKVHMFGICGISGIGKTTLAKAIYNKMFKSYKRCCFFEHVHSEVKKKSITEVQMLIINNILKAPPLKPITNTSHGITLIKDRVASEPILLVLDDVDDREQLKALAGSPDWFCPGSLIIFTSKDKQLLNSHDVEVIHDMSFLATDKALELFSWHAFREKYPKKDFEKLSYQVVNCLQGHPLALEVWGTHLYGKSSMSLWEEEVVKLQKYQKKEIREKLRPSFDGLESDQKKLFLDIACSFVGENKEFVATVLKGDDCFPHASIEVLLDKSLITLSRDDSLQMHELIRSMARDIVREESKWIMSDSHNALDANHATEAVEVFDLLLEESSQKVKIEGKAFARMKNLRILKICDKQVDQFWHTFKVKLWKESKVNYSGRLDFLSDELRLLYWHGCPFELFPSNFYPENIVAIDLSYSRIKNLWTTPKSFGRLEVMKLKHCRNLASTPDFTMITNLKELILEGCVNLVEVHPSVGLLKGLVVLNMRNCKRFKGFPREVQMDSLEVMDISGCSKVDKLPKNFGEIRKMRELCVVGTAITEFPAVSHCNLEVLKYGGHEMTHSRWWTQFLQLSLSPFKTQRPQGFVMPSLERYQSLRELKLRKCNLIEVHDTIGSLSNLESLDLGENNFTSLPRSLTELGKLANLSVRGCKKLEVLPKPPLVKEHYLDANFCTSLREVEGLTDYDNPFSGFSFKRCPNMFRSDLAIESPVSASQPQPATPSITSHSSRNRFSDVLQHMNFPSDACGIFEIETYNGPRGVCMIYHGNKIPEWFTTQSMGSHVKVELPQDLCGPDISGYGICVIFKPKKSHRFVGDYDLPRVHVNSDKDFLVDDDAFYSTSEDDSTENYASEDDSIETHESKDDSIGNHEADTVCIVFSTDNWELEKAKNFVTFSMNDSDDLEVKEFGARFVFKKDIQEGTVDFSIVRDLPTPTQDGGAIGIERNFAQFRWTW